MTFEYVYETEEGTTAFYRVKADTLAKADVIARKECPDALDAQIEVNINEDICSKDLEG